MKPEVMEAIRMGNMHFCVMDDLLVKSGKWIAKLVKAPEGYTALVTEGCASCDPVRLCRHVDRGLHRADDEHPRPARAFPRPKVIILAGHRDNFDHQIRQTGVKLVVVNTKDELIAAINERTVGIHFNHIQSNRSPVTAEEVIAIAKVAQYLYVLRCLGRRSTERAAVGASRLGLRHCSVLGRQRHLRTAGDWLHDRQGKSAPLGATEHEPAGEPHWPRLQGFQESCFGLLKALEALRKPGLR